MKKIFLLLSIAISVMVSAPHVRAQTTAFTYQGSLQTSGSPAYGNFDFQLM
jgi:hypothetical protein